MKLPTLDYMIGIARESATITGREYAVVLMDSSSGTRRLYVLPVEDTDGPEFEEFDGHVLCVVQP